MAENNEQNNEQKQQFICTGDCLACSKGQRQYCTCQMAYNLTRIIQTMQGAMATMTTAIEELTAKIVAIQEDGDTVFEPTETLPNETDIAQNGQRRRK